MGKKLNNNQKNAKVSKKNSTTAKKKISKKINTKPIKNKSKYIVLLILMLISVVSISYAVTTIELNGEKKYSLTIGTLDFKIDNEQNSIRLMNAYPMSDEEGQSLRPYTFTVTNTGTINEYYKVSLITDTKGQDDCKDCTFLSPEKLRYSLTIDGVVGNPQVVAENITLDKGELTPKQSKNYELRLWLNSEATIEEENKFYYGRIKVDASQEEFKDNEVNDNKTYVNWKASDGYSETVHIDSSTSLVKISDEIITTENILGLHSYLEGNNSLINCGENCVMAGIVTQEMIDESTVIDEETGMINYGGMLIFMPITAEVEGINLSSGVWMMALKPTENDDPIPIATELIIGPQPSVRWTSEDGYLETIAMGGGENLVKISNEILTTKNMPGVYAYALLNDILLQCGENCIMENTMTQELIDNLIRIDEATGIMILGDFLLFVPETTNFNGITISAGIWTVAVNESEDSNNLIPVVSELRIGTPSIDWTFEDGYSESILFGDSYLVKISDEVITTKNVLGLPGYIELNDTLLQCGESCSMEVIINQEMIDESFQIDEATGMIAFGEILIFVPKTINLGEMTLSPGVWTVGMKSSDSDSINIIVNKLKLGYH